MRTDTSPLSTDFIKNSQVDGIMSLYILTEKKNLMERKIYPSNIHVTFIGVLSGLDGNLLKKIPLNRPRTEFKELFGFEGK